jgi:hypothetical protein
VSKEVLMAQHHQPMLERICRALCQVDGNPTDTKFQGKPMWESYRREARAAIDASGIDELLDSVRYMAKTPSVPVELRHELAAALERVEGKIPRTRSSPTGADEGKRSAGLR